MTLEEAIILYEDGAKITWNGRPTVKAEECQQMVEWLKDYKQLLEQYNGDIGEISDGCHTFNQLYHQRAILFATIVNQNTDIAWKSYKHSDGKYCFDSNGEWFIVGVDTPEGSYTYHYSKEYWNYFKCKELDCGKEWDGHTEEDVTRLLSLEKESCDDCVNREAVIKTISEWFFSKEFHYTNASEYLRNRLDELPPVTPQPKMGKWLIKRVDGYDHAICSVCGDDSHLSPEWDALELYKYCPNCGCKMQEVKG